jgi:hypothetical protein
LELSDQEMLELAQFAFARMDGAGFLALARELGTETAWKMDVEAFLVFPKLYSYIINGWPVTERGGVKKIPLGIEPMQAERKKCIH